MRIPKATSKVTHNTNFQNPTAIFARHPFSPVIRTGGELEESKFNFLAAHEPLHWLTSWLAWPTWSMLWFLFGASGFNRHPSQQPQLFPHFITTVVSSSRCYKEKTISFRDRQTYNRRPPPPSSHPIHNIIIMPVHDGFKPNLYSLKK